MIRRTISRSCHLCRCFSTGIQSPQRNVYLRPLLKEIHPDLFASIDQPQVLQTNLHSIQTLQELSSMIDDMVEETFFDKLKSNTVTVRSPFQSQYHVVCFKKVIKNPPPTPNESQIEETQPDQVEITKIEIKIQTPKLLTTRQMVAKTSANEALQTFLYDYGKLWELFDLEHPWKSIIHVRKETAAPSTSISSTETQILKDFGRKLFDRQVIHHHRIQLHDQLFQNVSKYNKRGTSLNHKLQHKQFASLVDQYLRSGQVQLRDVSITKEVEVMLKLRTFLQDYGDLIKFGSSEWSSVFIVMYEITSKEKPVSAMSLYSLDTVSDALVLSIPVQFKTKDLLAFIHANLSFTKLSI